MKKFKFPLESVLKVRGLHKKLAEREVAQTQSRLNHTNRKLRENEEAYADTFKMMHQEHNRPFWSELALHYQAGLLKQREELEDDKDRLSERLEGEKRALSRKMKEEMVIEKLKDHQKQEHLRIAAAEEQAEIEEIDLLKRGNKS